MMSLLRALTEWTTCEPDEHNPQAVSEINFLSSETCFQDTASQLM